MQNLDHHLLFIFHFSFADYITSDDISIDLLEQFSNSFYPDLYCGCVEASEKACYEENILELWGDQVRSSILTLKYSYFDGRGHTHHTQTVSSTESPKKKSLK